MIRYLSLFFLLVQILLHAEERKEFKIGALAKRGAEITLTRWQPTAEYLEQVLPHYRFTIVPIGFDDIQESVAQKKIDFVIANSAYYIDLEMNYGVHRIATLKNVYKCKKCAALFGGVIFTKAGRDDIDTLNDIKGKTFAAVDPQSFGGWHAALYEFVKQGIDPEEDFADLAFAGTHDGAVYAVLNGEADAGTARTETIEAMEQEGKINRASLKIINQQKTQDNQRLLSTTLYPEWPFAKLDHISNAVAEEIMLALIAMPEHSAAAQKAGISGWTIPQNYQPIHECLKAIRVGPYKDFGKITLEDAVRNYWYLILGALLLTLGAVAVAVYISRLNKDLRAQQEKIVTLNDELKVDVRVQKELLASVADSINDLIFYKDIDLRYIGCNKAFEAYTGNSSASIAGKSDFEIFDNAVASEFRQADAQIFQTRLPNSINEWITYPDGSRHYMHTVKSPLLNSRGEMIGLVGIARDMSEFKAITDELESYKNALEQRVKVEIEKRREKEDMLTHQSKQVAMGEMIENIAHQWRQPINSLGLIIQDIKDAYEFHELDKAFIDSSTLTAMTIINKMSQTIDDFRNFFKREKEQKEFVIKQVVEEALLITGTALKNNHIEVKLVEHKQARAFGFANEYSQVIMNLLNNAKDALKKNKTAPRTITIEIDEEPDGRSRLTIADNDGGIPQEILGRIFEPYFTTKEADEGTGIGLYMSQVIIEKNMHGTLRAANLPEGGAVFTIIL